MKNTKIEHICLKNTVPENAVEFMMYWVDALSEVPNDYLESAIISVDTNLSDRDYHSLYYERPETDEEEKSRMQHEEELTKRDVEDLIRQIESKGLQWDIGHTGRNLEARIWDWPDVIGSYKPKYLTSLEGMLVGACLDAGIIEENNNV